MADIKICDRCGKKIEYRRGLAMFKPIFIHSLFNIKLFQRQCLGDCKFKEIKMDLCEDCSNKLVWFMEGAELDLGEKTEETVEVQ